MQSKPERESRRNPGVWGAWRDDAPVFFMLAVGVILAVALPWAAVLQQDGGDELGDLERLLAIEEIGRLKASYFRCVDTNDWACIETLFAPDASVVYNVEGSGDPGTPDNPLTGPAAITAFIRRGVEHLTTVHHGHMPEIEITSPTTATGIWAMEDTLQIPGGETTLQGWGHYHETYERIDGRWYIKTLRLTRLRVDRAE